MKDKINLMFMISVLIILTVLWGCQRGDLRISTEASPSCCQIVDVNGNTVMCDSRISEEHCSPPYNYYIAVDCEGLEGNPCQGKMGCVYNKTSYDYGETLCVDGKLWQCNTEVQGFKKIGDCVPRVLGGVLDFDFEEGSGIIVKDTSGNNNDGRLGKEGLSDSLPIWTTDTPFGKGYALSFDSAKSHIRVDLSDSLKGLTNNMENSFTVEAWIKPDINKGGRSQRIIGIPWIFYLDQRYNTYRNLMRYEFLVALDGASNAYLNNQLYHLDWVVTPWISIDNNWRHVAATYDSVNREIKIYINNELVGSRILNDVDFHAGVFSLDTDVPFDNPWWDGVTLDEQNFTGWQYLAVGIQNPLYEKNLGPDKFYGVIDEVKIFDTIKTCFDLDGDNYEDCACQEFDVGYEVNGEAISALPEDDVCPAGSSVVKDELKVYRKDTNGYFSIPVDGGLCAGEPVSLIYSKLGEYDVKRTVVGCDYSCYEDCSESCMNVYLRDCVYQCTRRCANSVCRSITGLYCGGEGGQNVSYCTYVYSHTSAEADRTECYNISLAADWNGTVCNDMCQTKCGGSSTGVNTAEYNKSCGYKLEETLELRRGSGCGSGDMEEYYQIGGYGTTNLVINAPQNPGNYVACLNGNKLGNINIKSRGSVGCLSIKDTCSLKLNPNHLVIGQAQKGSTVAITATVTNNASLKQKYDLKLYNKRLDSDTATSFSGAKPSGLKLNIDQTGQINPGESETFTITYYVPEQPYARKICEKKIGKIQLGCEVNTKKEDKQRYYSNLMIRAAEVGAGGGLCEASFNIDQTSACVEEICGNNKDDDCDGLINEGIIAVEVVNYTMHGSPEPYEGAAVNFYEYEPNNMPSCMPGTAPEYFTAIVNNCIVQASCVTDENGYCLTEVPVFVEPDHYMAIATIKGDTSKHLGVPVSAVHCGKIKKTWHLQNRDF